MSDQLPTNQVSLDDLKRAIDDYENLKDGEERSASVRLAHAWRTAFEWLNRVCDDDMPSAEHAEGFKLIRERLR